MKKRCILCGNNKFSKISEQVRDSKKYQIIKCKICSHIQLNPIPSLEEDKIFYDKNLQDKNIRYYGGIAENRKKSLEDTLRRVNFISKFTSKKNKILEIGSGHGFFLEAMEKLNFDITGIEISREKRKLAKRITKRKILNLNLNKESLGDEKFDVIMMFHVLEHLVNPIEFAKKLKQNITKKGKLIVEVPNSDDQLLFQNIEYTKFYWQRGHISYFNPKTLQTVFKKAGYNVKILGIQRYSIENMMNWKLTGKPQIDFPTYNLPKELDWIDVYYKTQLEKQLICDTLIAICEKK